MRTALVTGATGQDGSYLCEYLAERGYAVHGLKRRASDFNSSRVDHLVDAGKLRLHYGDLSDMGCLVDLLQRSQPDEVYNLAAQSHVGVSFKVPLYTADADALGPLRLLEAMRIFGMKNVRFLQASSSEMFGASPPPQNEQTPFRPCSPYGSAKLAAFWFVRNYREAHDMFVSNTICFNHESPRRGPTFVSRKITRAVAAYVGDNREVLLLGNLNAKRDWGHARDFVRGMFKVLQHHEPVDLVLATGEAHTVREFVERAYAVVDVEIIWHGSGLSEAGYDRKTGEKIVAIDPKQLRPNEVNHLCGDASLARKTIGWEPSVAFDQLVAEMVRADL